MTNEEFLRDVCPNHTDKSRWNKSELLYILELQKEQLRLHIVSQQRELLIDFSIKKNKAPKEFRSQYEKEVDEYLKSIKWG